MTTAYYIYDRMAHVSEIDRQKWARWIETGNDAAKHSWVGMAQVVTTFPGKRDWAGVVQFMATAVGPGRYIWKPGFSVCFVMDLDGSDVEEAQYCKGGLEQGEAMHARVLARRRCKDLENNGQNVEFADDEVPVAPTRQFRKPFAARLKTSLSALLPNWLTDLLSAEPLAAQRASLARALRLMALPGRKRNSQRRQVRKAHVHPFRRIHVHN